MTESNELIDLPNPDNLLTYQEFVSKIEIESVKVKKMNMEAVIAPDQIEDLLKNDERVEIDLQHEFNLESSSNHNIFHALGMVQAVARIADNVLFIIQVELVVAYDTSLISKEISDKIYRDFVQNNVPVNLWPYAREIIQNGTTRMGYPPLTIRPYRVLM